MCLTSFALFSVVTYCCVGCTIRTGWGDCGCGGRGDCGDCGCWLCGRGFDPLRGLAFRLRMNGMITRRKRKTMASKTIRVTAPARIAYNVIFCLTKTGRTMLGDGVISAANDGG